MPEEYNEWKLIKEYEHFGLYTNGKWKTCFDKFDVGLIEKRRKLSEVRLFNDTTGKCEQY